MLSTVHLFLHIILLAASPKSIRPLQAVPGREEFYGSDLQSEAVIRGNRAYWVGIHAATPDHWILSIQE